MVLIHDMILIKKNMQIIVFYTFPILLLSSIFRHFEVSSNNDLRNSGLV